MKNFGKMLLGAICAVTLTAALHAEEAATTAPGAILYIYSIADTPVPPADADPIAVVVDKNTIFSAHNLFKNEETVKFGEQALFLVWRGYITIQTKGVYTFAASYNDSNYGKNTVIQINGQNLLAIDSINHQTQHLNASASVTLEPGTYEITISHKKIYFGSNLRDYITLTYWNRATPLRKTVLTPAVMFHAE